MNQHDLWTVIGRAQADHDFGSRLFRNFRQALAAEGSQLADHEIEAAQQILGSSQPGPSPQAMIDRFEFETKLAQDRMIKQVERMNKLGSYTVKILKNTLDNAAHTFKTITRMNIVMFIVGIALFLFAAVYAAYSEEKIYSLVFGGLGTVSFVALFLLGSIEKSQTAPSNLVQVEISIMNYFEQITFWENFAVAPRGDPPAPDPENIRRARAMLQKRTRETIKMLQTYVEAPTRERRKEAG